MAQPAVFHIQLSISSAMGVEALREAIEAIQRIVDDQPWNDDAKEAAAALLTAAGCLTPEKWPE